MGCCDNNFGRGNSNLMDGLPVVDTRAFTGGGTIMIVTPEIAKNFLRQSHQNDPSFRNRPVNIGRVEDFAMKMKNQLWFQNTPASIAFDETGVLLDGQHRLLAIIKSGVPCRMEIKGGYPREAFAYIDCGGTRSDSDRLVISGLSKKDGDTFPSIIKCLHCYLNQKHFDTVLWPPAKKIPFEYIEKYILVLGDEMREGKKICSRITTKKWLPQRLAVPLFVLFSAVDKEKAVVFFDRVASGTNLSKQSPLLALRGKLTDIRSAKKDNRYVSERAAYAVAAWNAFYNEKGLQRFSSIDTTPGAELTISGFDKDTFRERFKIPRELLCKKNMATQKIQKKEVQRLLYMP